MNRKLLVDILIDDDYERYEQMMDEDLARAIAARGLMLYLADEVTIAGWEHARGLEDGTEFDK
jgi:hypothetical protein